MCFLSHIRHAVRRSSSKKGNLLPKQNSQPQLDTGTQFAYQHPHHHHHFHHHCSRHRQTVARIVSSDNDTAEPDQIEHHQTDTDIECDELCSLRSDCTHSNPITPTDQCLYDIDYSASKKMQNETTVSAASMRRHGSADSDGNESNTTPDGLNAVIDLTTDNLPAVDTPDACDKAAVR